MKAEWKTIAALNKDSKPVLIAKIRTEHEVLISPDTLDTVRTAIAVLDDDSELTTKDKARFAWELGNLLEVYQRLQNSETSVSTVTTLESEYRPFLGFLTLDTLKKISLLTENVKSIRVEGSPETGMKIVMQSGIDLTEIPVDLPRLQRIETQLQDALKTAPPQSAIATWIGLGIATVGAAAAVWNAYINAERLKFEQQKEEEVRKEKERQRQHERECRESRETSEGGPAHDALMDRISRIA